MEIKPRPHQISKAREALEILRELNYVYIAGLPRSGKTLTAILVAENVEDVRRVLVLTPKEAIKGWKPFTELSFLIKQYTVLNYEALGRIKNGAYELKYKPDSFDLVIVDESHNLGAFPKPSNRQRVVKAMCKNIPHIHLSGTAIVESPNSIYHQMSLGVYSPFSKFSSFYSYFRSYGKPNPIYICGRLHEEYKDYQPELLKYINTFTVYITQEEAGISKDNQAIDKIHYVELSEETRKKYNELQRKRVLKLGEDKFLVCDSILKLRTSLHMLESGVAKINDEYILLGNIEKIQYIKDTFGDKPGIGIMTHFVGERTLLKQYFKHAEIYSSISHAEGTDLSHLDHFIILSASYSGSKYIQRRERIINMKGSKTLVVNHILVKKAISEQVHKLVSVKADFNNSTYKPEEI